MGSFQFGIGLQCGNEPIMIINQGDSYQEDEIVFSSIRFMGNKIDSLMIQSNDEKTPYGLLDDEQITLDESTSYYIGFGMNSNNTLFMHCVPLKKVNDKDQYERIEDQKIVRVLNHFTFTVENKKLIENLGLVSLCLDKGNIIKIRWPDLNIYRKIITPRHYKVNEVFTWITHIQAINDNDRYRHLIRNLDNIDRSVLNQMKEDSALKDFIENFDEAKKDLLVEIASQLARRSNNGG